MILYVLRHASAGTRRPNVELDRKRPLDKDGKRHCLLLGHVLTAMKIEFDAVLTSPLKRSVQTASLVGTETGYEKKLVMTDALAPDATYSMFEKVLAEHASAESILVVGHDPNLSQFLGKLIGGGQTARAAHVRLRKGSIAKVSMERGLPELLWLMDPRMVKALYTTSTKSSRRKTSRK